MITRRKNLFISEIILCFAILIASFFLMGYNALNISMLVITFMLNIGIYLFKGYFLKTNKNKFFYFYLTLFFINSFTLFIYSGILDFVRSLLFFVILINISFMFLNSGDIFFKPTQKKTAIQKIYMIFNYITLLSFIIYTIFFGYELIFLSRYEASFFTSFFLFFLTTTCYLKIIFNVLDIYFIKKIKNYNDSLTNKKTLLISISDILENTGFKEVLNNAKSLTLDVLVIPVIYNAINYVDAKLKTHTYNSIIIIADAQTDVITVQRIANNLMDSIIPDHNGILKTNEVINQGLPETIKTTANYEEFLIDKYNVRVSDNPGYFVYNKLYFDILSKYSNIRSILIYLPKDKINTSDTKSYLYDVINLIGRK